MRENVLRPKREKVFFAPGNTVKVKHDIENVPSMVVSKVDKITMAEKTTGAVLQGITCFWFDKDQRYQTQRFNTKDLIKTTKDD